MEQPRLSPRARVAAAALIVASVAGLGWLALRTRDGDAATIGPERSRGVVAEVLNGGGRGGLARQVTRLLRERGVDVVYFGTAPGAVESTTVYVRRGDRGRGHEVGRLLGVRRVEVRPDSTRRVDVTVMLGADYRLPAGRPPF